MTIQLPSRFEPILSITFLFCKEINAVSYTHLDVYKRQDGLKICHQHQYNDRHAEKREQPLNDSLYIGISHTATSEHDRSHRRSDGADTQIEGDHQSKMNRAHSKALTDRQENRRKNKNRRRRIHESSQEQKKYVHYK